MKRRTLGPALLVAGTLAIWSAGPTAQQSGADVALRAAMETETVKGDLKGAIAQYQAIAKGSDRAIVAKALVRMAECYEKLGDAESRTIYDRLIREFSDQGEPAALARARLAKREPIVRSKGERAAWTGDGVDPFGQVSPDGRTITYVDWRWTYNVMLHDLATNTNHAITLKTKVNESGAAGGYSAISKDGQQVAYAWQTWGAFDSNERHTHSLYVAPLQEGGHRRARLLFAMKDDATSGPTSLFVNPFDWSPDGKWIALTIERRKDGIVQVALASVADGSVRVLKTLNWRGTGRIFFSPDGKYITYSQSVSDTTDESHVQVLAVDGSREITAVEHSSRNWPLGWSPDGRRLLFASDRAGSVGLWSLSFDEGKPQGSPELLKADIGSVTPLGITNSGALYVYKEVGARDIQTASLDVEAGRLGPAMGLAKGFVDGPTVPDWSPDGKRFAYAGCDSKCLVIRSAETGESHRLRSLYYTLPPRWSPDGRSLMLFGRDFKGRNGMFRVDAENGQASLVAPDVSSQGWPQWSADARKIYYVEGAVLREHDLSSEAERAVFNDPWLHGDVRLSPDGQYVAVTTDTDPATKTSRLLLVPASGGEPRELMRLTAPSAFGREPRIMAWTADGSALLVQTSAVDPSTMLWTGNPPAALWKVPIAGGAPRTLDIDVNLWRDGGWFGMGFSLSPDGRRIAFLTGKSETEVWALENFLSMQTANK